MKIILLLIIMVLSFPVSANDVSYSEIAKRNTGVGLSSKNIDLFKMHGECLVGLKELNFKKNDKFDPVAEWTRYRSLSLLEQFPPCEVLIMMEVARKMLLQRQK